MTILLDILSYSLVSHFFVGGGRVKNTTNFLFVKYYDIYVVEQLQ